MIPLPDRDLGAKLAAALPAAEPSAIDARRIRTGVDRALESERRLRSRLGWFVAVTVGALVVLAMTRFRAHPPSESAVSANPSEGSLLALETGARVLVRPGSDVHVERDDEEGTSLELRRGTVFATVEKRRQGAFTIRCADALVEVMGTVFGVEATNGGLSRVAVVQGAVAVRKGGTLTLLRAGESWPSDEGALRPADAELERLGTNEVEAARAAPASPVSSGASTTVEPSRVVDAKSEHVKARATPSDPRWQRAKQAELSGNWAAAAALYREIAASSRELAEDALFALGRMEQRQGHAAAALSAFGSYRDRFPEGAYARAADAHVLELLVASGEKTRAFDEATRFLRAFPADARAWKFRQTRAWLYAERGDCASARADLEQLPPSDVVTDIETRCAGRP